MARMRNLEHAWSAFKAGKIAYQINPLYEFARCKCGATVVSGLRTRPPWRGICSNCRAEIVRLLQEAQEAERAAGRPSSPRRRPADPSTAQGGAAGESSRDRKSSGRGS